MTKNIFIAGSGGIGEAAALLLREWSDIDLKIFLGDLNESDLRSVGDRVIGNSKKTSSVETVVMPPDGINDEMKKALLEAREEYNRLVEMEKQAEPDMVDYYVYRIKAQVEILNYLKRKLYKELAGVGQL